jgi:hypothetical protein
MALREFQGIANPRAAERLSLSGIAPHLAGRPIWVSIGNQDARVGTDRAIAFTRTMVAIESRGQSPDAVIPVDLLVAPTAGHTKIDRAHEILAEWMLRRFGMPAP